MAIISSLPLVPSTENIALKFKSNFSESPFSGAHVSTTHGFTQWQVTLGFPPATADDAKRFMAWLDSLRGQLNSFNYQPQGSGVAITGKTLASTAFSTTNAVNVGGWAAGEATGLSVGDYCQIGSQFYRIVNVPSNANGSGIAQVAIEPFVRAQVASGAAVNFASPQVQLRLQQSDEAPALSRDADARYLPTLTFVEAR